MDKKKARIRRATRARAKIRELGEHRLCVHRSPRHIYAQVIAPGGDQVLASASTLDKDVKSAIEGHCGNVSAAAAVGKAIAERHLGLQSVDFGYIQVAREVESPNGRIVR